MLSYALQPPPSYSGREAEITTRFHRKHQVQHQTTLPLPRPFHHQLLIRTLYSESLANDVHVLTNIFEATYTKIIISKHAVMVNFISVNRFIMISDPHFGMKHKINLHF